MIDIALKDRNSCMGCHACSNICPTQCITMECDVEGFRYPSVDYKQCIRCGQCVKVCPIIDKITVTNEPRAYACMNKDESIRLDSSSGGLFTLIAERVIDKAGVVFGAGFDNNFMVCHSYVETKEGLEKLKGSKYVQSRIGDTYKHAQTFLEQGRFVLFSGTPCQIGGLKSYLGKDYKHLFCIDIVCHGVPSPKVWRKYISYRKDLAGESIRRITFRHKNEGWKRFSVSFLFKNNTEYLHTFDKDLYMRAFLKDICLRPSCYACEFKTLNRESDITLADFWGIQNILPEMDDDKGTSLIFVNSDKGQSMLEDIKSNIKHREVDINKAVLYNSAAIRSVKYNLKREKFFNELDNISFDTLVNKYCSDRMVFRVKRKIIGMVVSILRKTGTLALAKKYIKR